MYKLWQKYWYFGAITLPAAIVFWGGLNSIIKMTPSNPPAPASLEVATWIYPGHNACSALTELEDGRKIDVVKIEWFTVTDGQLKLLTDEVGCNGYSTTNATLIKQSTSEQYVTVSAADPESIAAFLTTSLNNQQNITTLVDFVIENELSGIELDFESFSAWDQELYQHYLSFVDTLGSALHHNQKKLLVDGPAIWNNESQSWFPWHYADFAKLPVDKVVVMTYDYQFDFGAGNPIAPLDWIRSVVTYVTKSLPQERLAFGLPSYGYQGATASFQTKNLTYTETTALPGFNTAKRDPGSAEMTWTSGDQVYFYNDTISLNTKKKLLESLGVQSISIWHLGGNQWFSNQ